MFSVIYNTPLFYQVVLNLSAAGSGVRLIPNSIGSSIGSLGYGILMAKTVRHRLISLTFVGTLLLAWNVGVLSSVHRSRPSRDFQHFHSHLGTIYLCVSGSSRCWRIYHNPSHCTNLGCARQRSMPLGVFLTIDQATATGMSYLFRSTGQVVGITTTQCVLQNLLKVWLKARIHVPNADYVTLQPPRSMC